MGRGKRRPHQTYTVGSYEPLGGNPPSGTDTAQDTATAALLQDVADMVFKGGPLGAELSQLDLETRTFTFRHLAEPDPRPLTGESGEVPVDDHERAATGWTPQPGSPAWAHLAHLLEELPFIASFREYGPHGGPTVLGIESPTRQYADVLVEHKDTTWRVRVQLEGRQEPLEFPGMTIGELFGENRHHALLREGVVAAGI
ncbi:hypothetical protein [Streptomyces sp. NPDC021622]|uniref:hypothetical protein n=1 Tax=Streptomyces sp. NPDC021622 TaxID=3155013 RepID=UPI0033D80690